MNALNRLALLFAWALAAHAVADESLPRVLILGDSVYQQPARDAAKELKEHAEVVYPTMQPGEIRNTTFAISNFEKLLGEEKWDLIYFNFGLGDLVYRAPNMQAFRVMAKEAGGVRATSPEAYEKNLELLVEKLKQCCDKLIWASTTPIRYSSTNVFDLKSEIQYNAIATKVMTSHKVPIHDMYGHVIELIDMDKPASHGADPFFFDRKPLHPFIVNRIVSELDLNTAAKR